MLCCVLCSYHLAVCTRSQDTLGAPRPWARAALSPSMPHCQVLCCHCHPPFAAHGTDSPSINCHLMLQSCVLSGMWNLHANNMPAVLIACCTKSHSCCWQPSIVIAYIPDMSLSMSCLCNVVKLLPVCVSSCNCCLPASLHRRGVH